MTKYRPADFADDETSSMGSIQIGENSNSPSGLHVRFENPGANNHNLHNNSGTLAYLQQQMVSGGAFIYTVDANTRKLSRTRSFHPISELQEIVAHPKQLRTRSVDYHFPTRPPRRRPRNRDGNSARAPLGDPPDV